MYKIAFMICCASFVLACGDEGGNAVTHLENESDHTTPDNHHDNSDSPIHHDNSDSPIHHDEQGQTDNDNQNSQSTDNTNQNNQDGSNGSHTDSPEQGRQDADKPSTNEELPVVPFDYELTSFPAGEIVNHEGEIVKIKPFKLFTHQVYAKDIWECLINGQCSKSIFFNNTRTNCIEPYSQNDSMSINCITYEGAVSFCHWLGGRLPTEAEWEYAALWDGQRVRDVDYAWGNEPPDLCVNSNYRESDDTDRYCGCHYYLPPYAPYISSVKISYEYISAPCVSDALPAGNTPTGLTHISGSLADYVAEFEEDHDNITYMVKGGSFLSPPEKLKIREREYVDVMGWNSTTSYAGVGFRCLFEDAE